MKVKMILPALTEAKSPFWRPIKYALFPPLGLVQLAGYLHEEDEIDVQDEHVETLCLDDQPELVAIEVYITAAYRAYQIADHYRARGAHVCLGGLHVTSCPEEAALHADTVFLGPGEDTWPRFLQDFRAGHPNDRYQSITRSITAAPPPRRDLIKRAKYLVPNAIVVSRGCPHACEFCYKEAFFKGGRSFYTQRVDQALQAIEALPGRHLYFLDDHLFGNRRFACDLFDGMKGMGRLWQAAGTVNTILNDALLDAAVDCGLRSLFVGFETLSPENLRAQRKVQNLDRDYGRVVKQLHDRGVMVNASFVFGMDGDRPGVFDHTVDWALSQGIETATFHILTPYPGTALHTRMRMEGRLTSLDWNRYDTRHCVYQPVGLTAGALEEGYWQAYDRFYRWSSIFQAASRKEDLPAMVRHLTYSGGWKKFEALWGLVIRSGSVGKMRPLLEKTLSGIDRKNGKKEERLTPANADDPLIGTTAG